MKGWMPIFATTLGSLKLEPGTCSDDRRTVAVHRLLTPTTSLEGVKTACIPASSVQPWKASIAAWRDTRERSTSAAGRLDWVPPVIFVWRVETRGTPLSKPLKAGLKALLRMEATTSSKLSLTLRPSARESLLPTIP